MNPDRLHDIVEPVAVSWMPETVGWIGLALLLTGLLSWWASARLRAWRAAAYRREALAALEELRSGGAGALPSVPALVKRVAISAAGRRSVAALSGPGWLEFLDRSYVEGAFTDGPGRILPDLAYASEESVAALDPKEVDALFTLLADWIRAHQAPHSSVGTKSDG
jgi:hypothetical protein